MANPILNAFNNAMKSAKENMSGFDEFKGYSGKGTIPETMDESTELSPREFARVFDPTSNTDVMKMQGMLGVEEDGILGPKTLRALRSLQGMLTEEEMGESVEVDEMGSSYGEPAPFEYKTSADIDEPLADFMLRHNMPQRPDMPLDADVDDYSFGTTDSGVGRLERENLDRYFPDTDMSVFRNAMTDDSLGNYMELDMGSDASLGTPSTLPGINQYDPDFMPTMIQANNKLSNNRLRALINQALNVTTRK